MNKELQSFAYISSHDLQEPLRKIQTFASRIVEKEVENLSDKGKDYFKRMQDSALRMQTLIDDLLAYSRTNSADRKFENTDLNKIVEEVRADFNEELKEKDASIVTTGLCELRIIPFQFRQLLQNLVSNSLKFADPARLLTISIASEIANASEFQNKRLLENTNYCHISIADNGIGFDQQFSERIFELFQRLHGRQQYKGTGIGLAIVKKIVENHAGIITACGELNKGATFDIFLPVAGPAG
jgi:light-regulated signal transduction histidine kinase (bacteriophytochrome)